MRTWKRVDFGPFPDGSIREKAEEETRRDLRKPIEQLLCNVHEESLNLGTSQVESMSGAFKRMVSMMARVAIENEKNSKQLPILTWGIALLTVSILWLTVMTLLQH